MSRGGLEALQGGCGPWEVGSRAWVLTPRRPDLEVGCDARYDSVLDADHHRCGYEP